MQPTDLLFQSFSNLTGGVVTDVTTAMMAMVFFMVLMMGYKKLLAVFEGRILDRNIVQAYGLKDSGGMQGDFYSSRYKSLLNKKVHSSADASGLVDSSPSYTQMFDAPPMLESYAAADDHLLSDGNSDDYINGNSDDYINGRDVPYYERIDPELYLTGPITEDEIPY